MLLDWEAYSNHLNLIARLKPNVGQERIDGWGKGEGGNLGRRGNPPL